MNDRTHKEWQSRQWKRRNRCGGQGAAAVLFYPTLFLTELVRFIKRQVL